MMDPHYYEKRVMSLTETMKDAEAEIVALKEAIKCGLHHRINRPLTLDEQASFTEQIISLEHSLVALEAAIEDSIKKGEQNGELFVKHIPS